jgi:hypothetical protein
MGRTEIEKTLPELIAQVESVTADAHTTFGGLSVQQLNWKPEENQWSVGQCFDHLIVSNGTYFPIFEAVVRGENKSTFWKRLPLWPGLMGRIMIKSLDPFSTRRYKTQRVFTPSAGPVGPTIIDRFVDHQWEFVSLMKRMEGLALRNVIISSPVSGLFAFSALDALTFLVLHERRHYNQAVRVTESPGFPRTPGLQQQNSTLTTN